jgi:hypothetical protein
MEEGLPKVPKLELAQFKFVLSKEATLSKTNNKNSEKIKEDLLSEIIKDSKSISIFIV